MVARVSQCQSSLGVPSHSGYECLSPSRDKLLTILTAGDQDSAVVVMHTLEMFFKIRLWELSLTSPMIFSVPAKLGAGD